ncbi:acylneuraminate cytidylyltransferase [Clostridium botulinum]|nr:acylneuraminate cytidylyltransferase [Clostridium botulinum]
MNVAFIPLRGGSKSIPLKNIKLINGIPLAYWAIDATVNCRDIDIVYVSTDSEEIKKVVEDYNSDKIKVIGRSKETARDTASTEMAMLEFAQNYDFDNIVLVQVTSPMIKSEDISNGFKKIRENNFDSILSVVRQKRFIWNENKSGEIRPYNYNYMNRPRRQEFDGFLVENGAFYITSKTLLLKNKCRISNKIGCVEMDEKSYFEIDELEDWYIVEELLKQEKPDRKTIFNNIRMLLTDSDGVLTDGGMYYSENGDEIKKFNTKDGMAFELLKKQGIITGIITGESRELIKRRAEKMQVNELYMGVRDKLKVVKSLCEKYDIAMNQIVYIGDDINDIDVIKNVGIGCATNDAMKNVKKAANYITKAKGGQGVVREVAEEIFNNSYQ